MKCLLCGNKTNLIIAKELRNSEKRDVFYCQECALGMLNNNVSETELKKFYESAYRKQFKPKLDKSSNPKELFDIYVKFQGDRIKYLKKYLKKDMRLLEIGCSAGMFLSQVKKYVKEVVGLDYDSRSARFAAKRCKCKVYDCGIEETGLKEGYFDVICMFQVLEHTKNPHEFISKAKKYLKDNGIICIEVPNLFDALIYAYNLPNHYKFYFHSAHLWYFTAKSLGSLMKGLGFDGKIYFTQDYNILNHMHWIAKDAPQKDCVAGLSVPGFLLRGNKPQKIEELNKFIRKIDDEYKRTLQKLGITSNIIYIGKKTSVN